MKRRDFLHHTTKGIVIPSLINGMGVKAFANSPMVQSLYNNLVETDKVMVLVYLGGGNDGLNTVVPLDQMDKLANARSNVLLPENSLLHLDGVSNVALHPSLTSFRDLYNEGNLAILQNVGYPDQDYSHFRSTDIWMTGSDANQVIPSGWAGRYLHDEYPNFPLEYPNETMPDPLAIELGYDLSVMFQGPISSMGMVVGDPNYFYELINNITEPAPDTKPGRQLDYIRLIKRQSQVYGDVIKVAAEQVTDQVAYPEGNDLAEQLKVVSRLIAGGLKTRLYMVSIHGFDTHEGQVDWNDHTQGEHASLLSNLSGAIDAFTKDLKYQGTNERVVGVTFSEFGRRVLSNASNGTDHGSAAPMFIFGDGVAGGVYGNNPVIPDFVDWDFNLPMEIDFRNVYASIFRNWFCVEDQGIDNIFFDQFGTMPIIENSPCFSTSTHQANQVAGKSYVKNYPNPFVENTRVSFESFGGHIQIDIHNIEGRKVKTLVNGNFEKGVHEITWNAKMFPAGTYYANVRSKDYRQAKALIKVQ